MDKNFPVPFAGITKSVAVNPNIFAKMLEHITTGCGERHSHNFALEMDSTLTWPVIYGSELLMECMDKVRW